MGIGVGVAVVGRWMKTVSGTIPVSMIVCYGWGCNWMGII